MVDINNVPKALDAAQRRGVLAGVALGIDYPELDNGLLICVTETNQPEDIDLLCETLVEA